MLIVGVRRLTISTQKASLESLQSRIDTYKADIKSIESVYARGENIDQSNYDNLLAEHNRLVREFNSTRNKHNALVDKFNSLVNERNKKVSRLKQLRGGY
jgi:hemoglobin-like flavoprotein